MNTRNYKKKYCLFRCFFCRLIIIIVVAVAIGSVCFDVVVVEHLSSDGNH